MFKSLVIGNTIDCDYEVISEKKYRITFSEMKRLFSELGNNSDRVIKSIVRNKREIIITLLNGIVLIITLGLYFNALSISTYLLVVFSAFKFVKDLEMGNWK